MTIKRVRLNTNVHEKLLQMKEKNNARSINDVIQALITIVGETDLNKSTLNVENRTISFKYSNGKLVEIQIKD